MEATVSPNKEPIALVGSSIRFPGANSPSKLWELLNHPHDILEEQFPPSRMNLKSYYHPNGEHHGSTNVQKSYVISQDHRVFDATFFNITPLEAEAMDPQQRILLEVVYEAMESAGSTIEAMQGSQTSVFVGVMSGDYSTIQLRDADTMPKYAATGMASSILSNRISYFFDWKGPSMTIDTACSSSLVGVHQAVQSLRNGESRAAVAAGVNLILAAEPYIAESKLHMLSPDSRSRMWDSSADGYARGDGFAAVILKTLSQALKDGDHIESIIRETGVNSDGRTAGITMPSVLAQEALIRQTYQRAGLDCCLRTDRCQYFEAHGTGTPAGDPVEAEAVKNAFFSKEDNHYPEKVNRSKDSLYIGSIKTVVGHLEGCAGLAGLLKASLAVQNGVIPPNMNFKVLNPAIKPFYANLQIPIIAHPWPDVPSGSPRRASVNSFGFGGTNAHAIVESYDPECRMSEHTKVEEAIGITGRVDIGFVGPLTFSANSESSLLATIEAFSSHMKANDSINLMDLSWTLQSRRTVFPVRAAFSGATRERLLASMDEVRQELKETSSSIVVTRSRGNGPGLPPRILGVFTGQGAQWPQMGRTLLLASKVVEECIELLQQSLADLLDPPSWTLKAELMADASCSRIHEAAIAQPLCTAVQIALVDLLRCAGVSFGAVVGHSSGEIAAAYAAGILSSSDAIRIAYLRGRHAGSARGTGGCSGAMMAVGISFEDALDFCQTNQFAGRLCIAASNAPNSVTLSGDLDAVEEAQVILGADNFTRVLKVDTAYHSHHMQPCVEPYTQSLRACNIQVRPRNSACVWISSVIGDYITDLELLKDLYWTDNMTHPVLFSQAIERAMSGGAPFDMIVEVGPHPALQGPVTQILKSILGSAVPYSSLLRRSNNEVETFSGALGSIWANFGRSAAIDFDGYRRALKGQLGETQPKLLKDLPLYSWDHSRIFWKESRSSKNSRFRDGQIHELLGRRCPDDSGYEMRWRNILHIEEIPWLRGHSFQGQIVFPGAAYIAMALEASKSLSRERSVTLVEVQDIIISRAIAINEDSAGVEVNFTLKCLEDKVNTITADFTCYSCPEAANASLEKNCSGRILVVFGEPSVDTLPPRLPVSSYMTSVDIDRFYRSLSELGLEYSGLFRSLTSVQRTTHMATSSASWSPDAEVDSSLMVHPALLDVAFQSMFASIGSVASAWTPYLPTSIQRVRVNMASAHARLNVDTNFIIDAYATKISPATQNSPPTICGDLDILSGDGNHLEIQVEGLSLKSISETNPSNDRLLFFQTKWEVDISSGIASMGGEEEVEEMEKEQELLEILERLSYLYLRELDEKTPRADVPNFEWYHQRLFEYIDAQRSMVSHGQHAIINKEWESDTPEQLFRMLEKFPEIVDIQAAKAVAENFPAVLRGETTMLEVLTKEDMLVRLYNNALGLPRIYGYVARITGQIAHRYPRMKILEVGAGTGAMTSSILDSIDGAFSSYFFTDISTGFFEKALERFPKYSNRMTFKALNIENDVADQGYAVHSYDMVIAANVLHATRNLKATVENVRRLLKPGGYLILLEPTGDSLRASFVMCGLPGWWLGGDDNRRLFPGIAPVQWDTLLRGTGFSGIDTLLHDTIDPSKQMYSAIVSQALDKRFNMIRHPLLLPELVPQIKQLLIIGGKTLRVSRLIHDIRGLLRMWNHCTLKVDDLKSLDILEISSATTVLCLTELDKPVFESITSKTFQGMQQLFNKARQVLWVTQGCRADNPYSNMTVGVARVLLNEMSHIDLQLLDIGSKQTPVVDAQVLTEALLRLVMKDLPDHGMLWSTEPELALEAGRLLIPRVVPDKDLNDRLNSSRRCIQKEISVTKFALNVCRAGESYCLRQGIPIDSTQPVLAGHVIVRVSYSLLCPLKIVAETYLYLCLGSIIATGERVIVLSQSNSSTIVTFAEWTCLSDVSEDKEEIYLQSIAAHLVAQTLLSSIPIDAVLLLHQPQEFLAEIVSQRALQVGVKLICTTSQSSLLGNDLWTYIHPFAPGREINKILPKNIVRFIDWSEKSLESVGSRLQTFLPCSCSIQAVTEFFGDGAKVDPNVSASMLRQNLATAISHSTTVSIKGLEIGPADRVTAGDFANSITTKPSICVIDWTQASSFRVNIKPLDPRDFLSHDKTYLLVGLTGELGQSLCRWMILNGARNLVLTSRNPKVDRRWLEEMRNMGATISVFPMDITSKQALLSVYSEVCRAMPSIAGVVNGAMVLSDAIFTEMTFEALVDVLRPKVDGTKNLNELFRHQNLDFFIMLSSVSAVGGYNGQSNYAAANMFMAGLAAQRRQRGLAASVIDIGMLTEIGYVARAGRALEDYLRRKNHCLPISEPEFHLMFAEAILAGRSGSGHQPEIITGLQRVGHSIDRDSRPPWFFNPRLSHCIVEDTESEQRQGGTAVVHIKKQLAGATNVEEAIEILQKSFSLRLEAMLQLTPGSINELAPLIDLGVDSLIAIEIRSWFFKELKVDMPVLGVLSGNSIVEICKDAVEKLFASGLEKPDKSATPTITDEPGENIKGDCEGESSGAIKINGNGAGESIGTEGHFNNKSSRKIRADSNGTEENTTSNYKAGSSGTIRIDPKWNGKRTGGHWDRESGGDMTFGGDLGPNFEPRSMGIATPNYGGDNNSLPKQSSIGSRAADSQGTITPLPSPTTPISEPERLSESPQEGSLKYERVEHMSYAQSRLWFLKAYTKDPTSYNVVLSYDIKGPLHIPRFEKAFQSVVLRHKSFRTCFFMQIETGEARQGILYEGPFLLQQRQILDDTEVQEEFDRMRNHVFELGEGKTFKAILLRQSPTWNTIVFGYHHILMDGTSFFMFLRDLDKAYRMQPLAPLINQYADFAVNQRLLIERKELVDDLTFWKHEFSDLPEPLPLFQFSRVRSRFASNTYKTLTVNAGIPQSHAMKIRQTSQQLRITPFHFHLAAIQTLLFCFHDIDNLCIGVADASRMDEKFLETVGLFLNLLPLRFRRVQAKQTFAAIAKNTSRKVYSAMAHSQLPFDVLLEELKVPRSLAHTPLFQVLVNYRMGALQQISLGDCELRHRFVNDARYPYDLLLTITEPSKETCFLSLTVRDDLYTSEACGLLMKSYIHLLDQICQNPLRGLDNFSLFSDSSAQLGKDVGRGRRERYDYPETISGHVDTMVRSNPNEIAVRDSYGSTLTYSQLAQRSNIIAAALLSAGVNVGSYVAVLCEPSNDSIASLLAILRLGAIYVPLDLQNPTIRLVAMIDSCHPSVIICQASTSEIAQTLNLQQVQVVDVSSLVEAECAETKDNSQANLPAFALYTSGSTGTPKGILLTQSNLMNNINGTLDNQPCGRRETVLQQSSVGFDLSLYQIFRALANGGKLIVARQEIRGDPIELSKLMLAENITFTFATPSEYSILLHYGGHYLKKCSAWRFACSGGENITSRLKQEFHRLSMPGLVLLNWFGPTEVGVFSSANVAYDGSESDAIYEYPSIGWPLPNVSVYIVDEQLRLVPTGFPGEICIGGACVGLRYINDDALTREKFITDTFASTEDIEHGWDRLYRSGDRGRLLGDGSIIFLGRMNWDSQIKLRGFRIELDDVASTILHTAKDVLTDAVVSVRGNPEFLVAFVVFSPENFPSDTAGFLKKLSSELPLPSYMRPAMIIPLDHLPKTTNGKRDRAALDTIPLPTSSSLDPPPLSSAESQLKSLWIETLPHIIDISHIDRDTGFFYVGGSSILLLKLQALIRETFGVKVPLVELFQANTLRGMASRVIANHEQYMNEIVYGWGEEEKDQSSLDIVALPTKITRKTTTKLLSDQAQTSFTMPVPNPLGTLVDWDSEIAVSDEELLTPMELLAMPEARSIGRIILLTGSTGFLGRTLLRKLVEDSRVAEVHCIAVPNVSEFNTTILGIETDKIKIYMGDLSMPNLGLSKGDVERLSEEVDTIVHTATEGSCLNYYQSLRRQNLGATKDLVRLALPRRIPIHFISSSRVVLLTGRTSLEEISIAGFYPPTDGSEGLTAAKWACERYLENINENLGLPVWIHRSCSLIGEGAAPTDVLNSLLKYAVLLKATPVLKNVHGFIDYAPVEGIVSEIFLDVINGTSHPPDERRPVTFIHHSSGRTVASQEFREHLEEQEGCPFEQLTLQEWSYRAKKLGISDFVTSYLEAMVNRGEPAFFARLLKSEKSDG